MAVDAGPEFRQLYSFHTLQRLSTPVSPKSISWSGDKAGVRPGRRATATRDRLVRNVQRRGARQRRHGNRQNPEQRCVETTRNVSSVFLILRFCYSSLVYVVSNNIGTSCMNQFTPGQVTSGRFRPGQTRSGQFSSNQVK